MNLVPFEVKGEELEDGIRIFIVRGELDMGTAPDLERELRPVFADPDASVMLDLSECEFIDSTGIALVVRLWQHLGQGTGHLVLCSPKLQVRRLLQITGVESSIPMHEQRDAALAALRG